MNPQTLPPETRPRIGFLTAYVPEELFHAAGFTPVFIFHEPHDHGYARTRLPSFVCWVVGSAFDQALAGHLGELSGMVIAKTCDATQGLADLWQPNIPHIPLLHFGMPLRSDVPSARAYLLAELQSLRERVQTLAGRPITEDALQRSIALHNCTRGLVRRLYARATTLPLRGTASDRERGNGRIGGSPSLRTNGSGASALYEMVRAAFQTPRETYNERIARQLDALGPPDGAGDAGQGHHPRVLLSGPGLGDPVLFEVLDRAGGHVVGDLFDLGERYFAVDGAEEGDPLEALTDRLMTLNPTPTKHHPKRTRATHLLSLVRERQADGVIFARQKFCEPHGFDYVQMAQALDRDGVAHLLVELEQASQAGQLRTRVEAFMEMLAG